jgi:ABC-type lipoprotein release transport system permease subunit
MKINDIKFIFFIAFRYFFSKKSQSAINLISLISMFGVAVSTMALVCVLSVFNGFTEVIEKSFSSFDPELKITAKNGKTFNFEEVEKKLAENNNIAQFSKTLSDNALIIYNNNQTPIILKGVDEKYNSVFCADSLMISGNFRLFNFDFDVSALGVGLSAMLGLGVDYINPVSVYAPRREGKINIMRPDAAFKRGEIYVAGIFSANQQQYDDHVLIVPLEFAQNIYDYNPSTVSAIELKLKNIRKLSATEKKLQKTLGKNFTVENRFEQQKDYFKIIKIEGLLIFLILALILLIAVCNIISSLSMLLIDKKDDILLFKNLGATNSAVRKIFIVEGWLIAITGAVIGLVIGLTLCILQIKFGLLKMDINSYIENYPVAIKFFDLLTVLATVLLIGFAAACYPVKFFLSEKKLPVSTSNASSNPTF